jgi:hypothetical protein
MNQRLGGLQGGPQDGGDLFVAQFSVTTQDQCGSLFFGQRSQGLIDQAEQFTPGRLGIGPGLPAVFDLSQGVVFVFGPRFVQRVGRMPDAPTDLVEA